VAEGVEVLNNFDRMAQLPLPLQRLREQLAMIMKDAWRAKEQAERSANIIEAMSQRWSRLSADTIFDTHIREIFSEQANRLMNIIDELGEESPDAAWSTYKKDVAAASENLFSEYVELLSGLALRDTGLGAPINPEPDRQPGGGTLEQLGPDVYVMADDLVKQLYHIGEADLWHSLTIPARRTVAACTVARMIRLGFPEWTIWAVPLAAHEFGRVVVDRNDFADDPESNGFAGHGLEVARADVFATYALGPAYAFASVYVLLDPSAADWQARGKEPVDTGLLRGDSGRAFIIFRTLELMNEGDALTRVIDRLRGRWAMAVHQAGGSAFPAEEAGEPLEQLARHMWSYLRDKAPTIQYSPQRWRQAAQWDPLGGLVSRERWRLDPAREDVRDILNAAWYQRLAADPAPDPATDRSLAEAALALWRRDLDTRRRSGRREWYR